MRSAIEFPFVGLSGIIGSTDFDDSIEQSFYMVQSLLPPRLRTREFLKFAAIRCYARALAVVFSKPQYPDSPPLSKVVVHPHMRGKGQVSAASVGAGFVA